jgi:hypothetical protein
MYNGGQVCDSSGTCVECLSGTDCESQVCSGGSCQPPTCNDGVHNGDETDVDCGGATCPGCGVGQGCNVPSDCASGLTCDAGMCLPTR